MLVRDVMTSPAITVSSRTTVKEGLRLLDRNHVTALPVVSSEGRLLGVVSEADLLLEALRHDSRTQMMPQLHTPQVPPRYVGDVMSTLALTVSPSSDLADAVELMTTTAVKSLPVVDGERVVGVVSRSDIVHLLAREDDEVHAEVDELLRSAGVECEVEVEDGRVRLRAPMDPHRRRVAEVIARSVPGVISVHVRE